MDAVVSNPPYIRQESIGHVDKSSYAELFRTEWPGQTMLSGRSDIYAYFFTHAAHLVKPGGYLGFVTSIGWLDTEYGFRLQEFFCAISGSSRSSSRRWRSGSRDARVTTAVTILQREQTGRSVTKTRFASSNCGNPSLKSTPRHSTGLRATKMRQHAKPTWTLFAT